MTQNVLYLDNNHDLVPKEKAFWKVIHNYDDEGKLIEEVWVDLKKGEDEA